MARRPRRYIDSVFLQKRPVPNHDFTPTVARNYTFSRSVFELVWVAPRILKFPGFIKNRLSYRMLVTRFGNRGCNEQFFFTHPKDRPNCENVHASVAQCAGLVEDDRIHSRK